jgi:outer membrane protein assembly factor BamD (BamD/ComL family)
MFVRNFLLISFIFLGVFAVSAQKNIEAPPVGDPIMETDALHNLDVARQFFGPGKKAYKAVLGRFEETFAVYPDFSKMDEFLYLAGMSSVYLSENKGRQKVNLKNEKEKEKYEPEKLRTEARAYFNLLVDKYSGSEYAAKAKDMLEKMDKSK